MNLTFLLKYIHIFFAAIMIGTTAVNGIMELHAMNKKDTALMAFTMKTVAYLNRIFMLPSLVMLSIFGLWLALHRKFTLTAPWLLISIILTGLLFIAFLLGSRDEEQLGKIAVQALEKNLPPNKDFERGKQRVTWIGGTASALIFVNLYFMVFK